MKAQVTAKVGMFVVSFSILAVWMLLPPPPRSGAGGSLGSPRMPKFNHY